MRTPSLHINSRVPTINPTVAPRINPSIAGRSSVTVNTIARTPPTTTMHAVPRVGIRSTLPYARYSPNLYPACDYAYRGSDGECFDRPVADGGGKAKASSTKKGNGGPRNNASQTAINLRSVPNELMAEIDGALTDAQADELARRHGLTRLQSQNFPLLGATIGLFRITDRRSVETVRRELAGDGSVRSVQLNFRYVLQDQKAVSSEGDPSQYALAQLQLPRPTRLPVA